VPRNTMGFSRVGRWNCCLPDVIHMCWDHENVGSTSGRQQFHLPTREKPIGVARHDWPRDAPILEALSSVWWRSCLG